MFGSLPVPCGPNTTGATLTASDKFVTANEIHISTISDPGGPKPGLDQSIFDTMKAFAAWCNGFGGINGRKVVVDFKDAKILQYKDRVVEACEDSFALVGSLGTLDANGAQDQENCGLPNIPAAAVSADVAGADLTFQPLPNPPNEFQIGPAQWVKSQYPDAPPKSAALYSNLQLVKTQSDRVVEGYTTQGYKFIYDQSANINETNWGPIVVAMKNMDVKYMTLTSSFEEIIPLQKEEAAQGWAPAVTELETNFYDARYPEQAKAQGADTSNTYVRLTVWPFEEADANPAMKQYLAELTKAVPDAVPAELGVQSWSAALMFATAAKNAGANLTRDSLVSELKKITSWNGGGLHGTSNPSIQKPAGCFVMMKVEDGKFVRAYPLPDKDQAVYDNSNAKGMACPVPATVPLTGDYGHGAKAQGK
jgi:ABC-type branched-subunit amino acid transport system substrate-binding protein